MNPKGETPLSLVPYAADPLSRAQHWTTLSSEDLRRRTVLACRDRDAEALWALTEAYFTTYGASGARASRHTLRAYHHGLKVYLDFAGTGAVNLLHPARDTGPTFLRLREASGRSAGTVRLELAAVRLFYRALRWAGATADDPFEVARPARDHTAPWDKRQPYTDAEVEALLLASTPETRAMLLFGAHAGLRVSEMLALVWNDLDLAGRVIRVRAGKGGKARRAVMSDSLREALLGLVRTGPDARLFPWSDVAVRKRLKKVCLQCGVPYRGFHALRHTSGTRLYRISRDLEAVARHLGHSTLDVNS